MSADLLLPLSSPTTFVAPHRRRLPFCGSRLPPPPLLSTPTFRRHPSSASAAPTPGEKGFSPRLKRKFEDPLPSPLALSRCERIPRRVKRLRGGAPHTSTVEPLAPFLPKSCAEQQRMSFTMEADDQGQETLHEVGDHGDASTYRPFPLRSPLDLSFASAQVHHRFSHPSSTSTSSSSSSSSDFPSPPTVVSSPWQPQPAGSSTASDSAMLPPPLPFPATATADVPFAIPSSTRRSSSPNFAQPPPSLNRNPKKLSLSLTMPASPVVSGPTSSSASSADTIVPTPSVSSNSTTPFTPGPPKTPALALSVGKNKAIRRPSLLSLITQPPTGPAAASGSAPMLSLDAPPTGGLHGSFFTGRPGIARARSNTTDDGIGRSNGSGSSSSSSSRSSRSAYPTLNLPTFKVIQEDQALTPSGMTTGLSISPPSTLSTTPSSCSLSLRTTPASSPPLVERQPEPYEDGPIEIVPGIWLGAEESVARYDVWARGIPTSIGESSAGPSKRVRVLNVAQEVDDPFEDTSAAASHPSAKGKEKAKRQEYPSIEGVRPAVDYVHLRWGHGEAGLAEIDSGAELDDILSPGDDAGETSGGWRFWQAVRWIEHARRNTEPVLIHCQCGVSRSATLSIAYIMALAATGQMPGILGEINSMQAAYDFVKAKSPCIGPNVSLVFQLVEFAKNVSSLLSKHLARPENSSLRNKTRFPTRSETLSEDEWARQRRAFDQEQEDDAEDLARIASPDEYPSFARTTSAYSTESWLPIPSAKQRPTGPAHPQGGAPWAEHMSPEDVEGEARRLDEEMIRRRLARV